MSTNTTGTRDALWAALTVVLGTDPGGWIRDQRESGASWRELEAACAEAGVPVSYEYLRSKAKSLGLDRKVA